jgi:hypothetical protein
MSLLSERKEAPLHACRPKCGSEPASVPLKRPLGLASFKHYLAFLGLSSV